MTEPPDLVDETPIGFALSTVYRALAPAPADLEILRHPADLEEEMARAARSRKTPPVRLPGRWDDPPLDPDEMLAAPADGDDEVDDELRRGLDAHPDVAVLLRMRRRRRTLLTSLIGEDAPDPDAVRSWHASLGYDDSPAGRRARARTMIDALCGTTPEAVARRTNVSTADAAARAWAQAATGHEPAGVLDRKLRETAVRMCAELDDRDPPVTLIQIAVDAVAARQHP
jgi:hypothetical protein